MPHTRARKYTLVLIVAVFSIGSFIQFGRDTALANFVVNSWQGYKLTQGLVGYWTMDGKDVDILQVTAEIRDGSGNGSHFNWINHATTTTIGKIGQAITFDDVDDYMEDTSVSSALNITGDITVSAWIKRSAASIGTYGGIFAKAIDNVAADYELYVNGSPSGSNIDYVGFWTSASGGQNVYNNTPITDTNWHHVLFTRTSGTSAIYIDGREDGGSGLTNSFTNGTSRVTIGTDGPVYLAGASNFGGEIDEVRVYNRGLSTDEIKRLYLMGASTKFNVSHRDELTSGLVGYWTLDGKDMIPNVRDVSGQGNHGGLQNQTPTTTTIGKIGQAIDFDGVDDYVDMGDLTIVDNVTQLTVSAWAKSSSLATERQIVTKSSCNGLADSGTFQLGAGVTAGRAEFAIYPSAGSPVSFDTVTAATTMDDGNWHHIVGVYDGADIKIYMDGVFSATDPSVSGDLSANNRRVQIGACSDGTLWNDAIDEVRIYNRALSADEVKRLYLMGASTKVNVSHRDELTSDLVGHWTLDGKDMIPNVRDASGNGKHGVLKGQTSTSTTIGKIGQAISFDGTNDHVDMGDIDTLDGLTALTASAWVKTTATGERHILDKSGCGGGTGDGPFELLMQYSTPGKAAALIYKPGGSPDFYVIEGATTINDGAWHHVAETYDGVNLRIYVDGVSDATPEAVPGITLTNTPAEVEIGGNCNDNPSSYEWNGSIDEVRVYNRALSAEEVKRLYLMGK